MHNFYYAQPRKYFMLKMTIMLVMFCLTGTIFAKQTSPIIIEQISAIGEPSKTPATNYSLMIKFKAQTTLSRWALGFYMPRSFTTWVNKSMNVAINPDLQLEICTADSAGNCDQLRVVTSPARYASAGFITVLSPINNSKLLAGMSYVIKLTHSNKSIPANYSAMPQSFFVIVNDNIALPVTDPLPTQYQFAQDETKLISLAVAKHNIDNWLQAKAKLPNSLADQFHLVPTPTSIKLNNQSGYTFLPSTRVSVTDEFDLDNVNPALLATYLKQDLNITAINRPNRGTIVFQKIKLANPEAYQLQIANNAIVISASTPAGIFYGLQTLRQLWYQNKMLPGLIIEDAPRYQYRGILLDVARHFFTTTEIEKLIDVMAAQKLNTLHLHLTDDEAWRLATDKKLVSDASIRGFYPTSKLAPAMLVQANLDISNRQDFSPSAQLIQAHYVSANQGYSGSYTDADIKALIAYANARQITIIPEIDLPGHARALIYAMPDIFKDANDKSIFSSAQQYVDNVIPVCLYNQQSAQGKAFTDTVNVIIESINTLFANQKTVYYTAEVSLAGDEVSRLAWSNDASCNGVWSNLSAIGKSHYFFSTLPRPGLLSGWQQLVQNDDGSLDKNILPASVVGHLWVWEPTGDGDKPKGIVNAVNLINAGYPTVLAYANNAYFDLTYTPDVWEPGYRWATASSDTHAALHLAFDAWQTEQLANPSQRNNLQGLEGALWSENLSNFAHLAYMALPKMTGLAEAAWASKDITTDVAGVLNWQSLAFRLGTDESGFLAYLHQISKMKYRGYPHGIAAEIPAVDEKL
jgi:hexosaminidase